MTRVMPFAGVRVREASLERLPERGAFIRVSVLFQRPLSQTQIHSFLPQQAACLIKSPAHSRRADSSRHPAVSLI